jgi:hypothetical protein
MWYSKELMAFVVAAVAAAEMAEVGDELDGLHHFTCLKPSSASFSWRVQPKSCAAINAAVRTTVAIGPNSSSQLDCRVAGQSA